jgi:uncharacterized protein GlcG (DUF336 family)
MTAGRRFERTACQLLLAAVQLVVASAFAQDATFTQRNLTPETALRAAQAALAHCRKDGFQVAVAVVDRSGTTQVLLRDRFAGPHTIDFAANKAWTAVSTRLDTSEIEKAPQRNVISNTRWLAIAGGVTIEAGGSLLGAIGVSGAPGGAADEVCAKAGLRAIADSLEF